MTTPEQLARVFFKNGSGPYVRPIQAEMYAHPPGVRPSIGDGEEIYCRFYRRFRHTTSPLWRKLVPTVSTFSREHIVEEDEAKLAAQGIDQAIVIHEFEVDIHWRISNAELQQYIKSRTSADENSNTYFMPEDMSFLVAQSHHWDWYIVEARSD